MQIRNPFLLTDPTGVPAESYAMHVGIAKTNPVNDANKVDVFDGRNGPKTSNPYYFDKFGRPINENGQRINPFIVEDSYSYQLLSPNGGTYDSEDEVSSDSLNNANQGKTVVDQTFNNLTDATTGALYDDLSAYETVYIESITSGWEDSVAGPVGGFYAHKDGTTGAASTGDQDKFYDAAGNGWTRDQHQRVDVSATGALDYDSSNNELAVNLDATDGALEVNGSNELTIKTDGVSVSVNASNELSSVVGLVSSTPVTATTNIDITLDFTTYSRFELVLDELVPDLDTGRQLQGVFGHTGGTVFYTGASDYKNSGTNANHLKMSNGNNVGSDTNECLQGMATIQFSDYSNTAYLTIESQSYDASAIYQQGSYNSACVAATSGIDTLRLYWDSGDWQANGNIYLYGYKRSL